MNKLDTATYYSFGWLVLFLLNCWTLPSARWFWGVDWFLCRDGYNLVWFGVVTVWWLPRSEWKWERMNGRKPYGWEWNID